MPTTRLMVTNALNRSMASSDTQTPGHQGAPRGEGKGTTRRLARACSRCTNKTAAMQERARTYICNFCVALCGHVQTMPIPKSLDLYALDCLLLTTYYINPSTREKRREMIRRYCHIIPT